MEIYKDSNNYSKWNRKISFARDKKQTFVENQTKIIKMRIRKI